MPEYRDFDGRMIPFDLADSQQFRQGPWVPGPGEPATVPDAPAWIVTRAQGGYYGWTHWGTTADGITARSQLCRTRKAAFRAIAEAVESVRKLMLTRGRP